MKTKSDFFWPSFTDLMTSLFFIMLVLYALTYLQLQTRVNLLEDQVKIINAVEANLKPLKDDKSLFEFEPDYNRYKLAFSVKFNFDKSNISSDADLIDPGETRMKIKEAGIELKQVIDKLKQGKDSNDSLKNVSYILVIAGYASQDNNPIRLWHNYEKSYERAFSLWQYWKENGVDFESPEYKGLIDLQISGNGWGGVGRLDKEEENQRFLIQIFPKIGSIK